MKLNIIFEDPYLLSKQISQFYTPFRVLCDTGKLESILFVNYLKLTKQKSEQRLQRTFLKSNQKKYYSYRKLYFGSIYLFIIY